MNAETHYLQSKTKQFKNKYVRSFAPASVANLGVGFDVLGMSIGSLGDEVSAKRLPKKGEFIFKMDSSLDVDLTDNPDDNIAAQVAKKILFDFNPDWGVEITLHKNMPIGSGLGSSASSSVASAVAINGLFDEPMDKNSLIPYVLYGEGLATGVEHGDNVVPSLIGGCCCIGFDSKIKDENIIDKFYSIPIHEKFVFTIIHPNLIINTKDARKVLPDTVSLATMTRQISQASCLIFGLMQGNESIISKYLYDDVVTTPRSKLIAHFSDVRQAALNSGASGVGISGSGPSLFAISTSQTKAQNAAIAMQSVFSSNNIFSRYYTSKVDKKGAHIIESSID